MSEPFTSSPILEGLNPQQREAVLACEGPVLILAGAGSGKTRVITHRVAHLIRDRRVAPERILAVTFTNKAANEMRARVAGLASEGQGCWISTFHSFCVRVLRRDGPEIGLPRSFAILDEGERLTVVRQVLRSLRLSEQSYPARRVLGWISRRKNGEDEVGREERPALDRICGEYGQRLAALQALDFDDLLLRTRELFADRGDVRERYRSRLQWVLVDEYQDTNRPQYDIVRLLAGGGGNITAVGDEDQSIYSWRGADIRNILAFERDFPGARVLRLEHNYRSNPAILNAAAAVVAHNRERKGKTLRATRATGDPVVVHTADSEVAEASWVVERLRETSGASGAAVLMRLNSQSRVFEEALRRSRIAYAVVGGVGFFERREVKDMLGYLRLVARPSDDLALRRVINVPPRGIGERTMAAIEAERGESLWDSLSSALERNVLPPRAAVSLRALVGTIEEARHRAQPLKDLVQRLIEATGYERYLRSLPQSEDRIGNLGELVSAVADYESRSDASGLDGLLDEVALASSTDEAEPEAAVKLMTLHAAKGLEFDTVFIVGLEEGLLPFSRAQAARDQVEEERRLCYVGMTRARDQLFLSWARSRQVFGRRESCRPSRFIGELPDTGVQKTGIEAPRVATPPPYAVASPGRQRAARDVLQESFRRGTPVRHATFGDGTVLRVDGSGPDAKLTVAFSSAGVKRLVARYAALEPL